MIRFLAFIFLLIPVAVRSEVYPALYDVTGVAADDVPSLRVAPDAGFAVIGTLAPNATGARLWQ